MNPEQQSEFIAQWPDNFIEPNYRYCWPSGWDELVTTLIREVVELSPGIRILQIKDKFAGLRFYYSGNVSDISDEAKKLIDEAETKSYTICQDCGLPGKQVSTDWIRTLCESCEPNYKSENLF